MEEDYIPDEPKGYWTESRPLYKIMYRCLVCGNENYKFQPLIREEEKRVRERQGLYVDYRQHCSTCKKIVDHSRHEPSP